ncbi:hypothetical protein AB0C02_07630 [Micromonospora sp. NPDC048999]|uniref:hypothetical protein n=1 Tax=Micromonospora sp. NPDC048999 TaxID=3155391 RepID=UPI00340FB1D2
MTTSLHRSDDARLRRLLLAAGFAVPGVLAALGNLFGWWGVALPVFVGSIAAFGGCAMWISGESIEGARAWKRFAVTASVAHCVWVFAMTGAPLVTVLDLRGEPVVARIVNHDVIHHSSRGGGYDEHCYRLQRSDGTPLSRDLCGNGDRYKFVVGEDLTVLVDPSGLFVPEIPDRVATARVWQGLGLVSFVAAVGSYWVAGVLLKRAEDRATAALEAGPHPQWRAPAHPGPRPRRGRKRTGRNHLVPVRHPHPPRSRRRSKHKP